MKIWLERASVLLSILAPVGQCHPRRHPEICLNRKIVWSYHVLVAKFEIAEMWHPFWCQENADMMFTLKTKIII